jgi:hypothetical protein
MAKEGYELGIGPFSNDVKLTRKSDPGNSGDMGRDISKLVDPSHQRNEGFSAKLDKGPKE